MNITCDKLDDLLFDASPLAMETAARHAEECVACAEKLAAWNEISDTAASLRTNWNNDLLWPRIERAIKSERRRPLRRVWQYAAAVLMTVALGATMWFALSQQNSDARFDERIINISALDDVERAEKIYEQAIARLETQAEAKLENDESPIIVSYKEKLMLLDDAIAECEANIEQNRQNAHLRKQLLAMYSEKQQTLRDVLREDTHVSTP